MAFIDNVKDKVKHAGQSTVKKAKDLSDLAKLNTSISSAETKISNLYGEIGYTVYTQYSNDPLPIAKELIDQVNELHQEIQKCKEQINAINSDSTGNTCPGCGVKVTEDMAFCSECGTKLGNSEAPVASESKAMFCNNCGAPIASDSVFCSSCGKKIG